MLSFFHSSNYLVSNTQNVMITNTRQVFGGFKWVSGGMNYWTVLSFLPDTLTTTFVKKIASGDVRGLLYDSTSDSLYLAGSIVNYLTMASMSSTGTDYFYYSIQTSTTYQ